MIEDEIYKVLEDLELVLPYPLKAEPEVMEEGNRGKVAIATDLVKAMSDQEKKVFWDLHNRYSWEQLLSLFRQLKQAEKGG
jgi:hypothetical protein